MSRGLLGDVLLASALGSIVLGAILALLTVVGLWQSPEMPALASVLPVAIFAFAIPAAVVSFVGVLIIGLPIHALLLGLHRRSIWAYLIGGLCAGLAIAAAGYLSLGDPFATIVVTFLSPLAGLVSAGAFWFIRRPDLDMPNPTTSKP